MNYCIQRLLKVNIGCGRSPTKGWTNFDSSPSVFLGKIPTLAVFLKLAAGWLLSKEQRAFITFANQNHIAFGDAVKGLPLHDSSWDTLGNEPRKRD
jgi:hypothetical protein